MLLTGKKFFFDIIYQLSILTDGKILQRSDGGGVFDVLDKMNGQTLCGCSTVLACQVCPNTYQRTLLLQIQTLDHLLSVSFSFFGFFCFGIGGGMVWDSGPRLSPCLEIAAHFMVILVPLGMFPTKA